MVKGVLTGVTTALLLFAANPSSGNYLLESYGVGTGGTAGSDSSNYSIQGITGEASGTQLSSSQYAVNSGLVGAEQANVPAAPTFTNPSNYYNKLHFVIDTGGNASDATFAIAISTDDFVTTNYVQSDNTVGASLGTEDYQTYTNWGGASGEDVVGLSPSTTYKIKVRAFHGKFTESAYSATATAATVSPTLSFDIDISASDTETSPPYTIGFGDLLAGTVTNSTQKIWFDFDTNANSGGNVYFYGQNTGLTSAARSYTIASSSTDLASANEGYGAQSVSATQSSGGPLSAVAPYDGTSQNVGIIDPSVRQIYTASAPVTGGRMSVFLKAKARTITPQATDYADSITAVASASF